MATITINEGEGAGWHTNEAPRRYVTGSIDINVSGSTISVGGSLNDVFYWGGHQSMGLTDTLNVVVDSTLIAQASVALPTSIPSGYSPTLSVAGSGNFSDGVHSVYVYMHCSDPDCSVHAYDGYGKLVGSTTVTVETYRPPTFYDIVDISDINTTPTGTVSSKSIIINHTDQFNVRYRVDVHHWVTGVIYEYNNNIVAHNITAQGEPDDVCYQAIYINKNKDNPFYFYSKDLPTLYNDTLFRVHNMIRTETLNGVTHSLEAGSRYLVGLRFSDGQKYHWYSNANKNKFVVYTYTIPKINSFALKDSGGTTITKYSPHNNTVSLQWSRNDPKWQSQNLEDFSTIISTNAGSIPANSVSYVTMTESNTIKLFGAKSTWAGPYIDKTITETVTNTGSSNSDTKSLNIRLQLQPDKNLSSYKILNANKADITGTVKNKMVDISTTPQIRLQWAYPYDEMASGEVSGFEIRIYKDSAKTQQVGSAINVPLNSDVTVKGGISGVINTETQLARNVYNYVKIFAYYTNNAGVKKYGDNPISDVLFAPYAGLSAPSIDYPINNTTWHNKNFRVLFKPPVDGDYASLSNAEKAAYRYADVEVNINNVAYKFSEHPEIFNETQLYHVNHRDSSGAVTNNYIVANPSLISSFPNVSKYTIKVRVAKKVGNGSSWSNYSTAIVLNKSAITDNTYTVGNKITAAHFNTIREYCVRLRNVYPMRGIYSKNTTVTAGTTNPDRINADRYQAIWDNVAGIQQDVNNYAKFDNSRLNVRFNQSIIGLSPTQHKGATAGDKITAAEGSSTSRNYLKIIFNDMQKLY